MFTGMVGRFGCEVRLGVIRVSRVSVSVLETGGNLIRTFGDTRHRVGAWEGGGKSVKYP